MSERTQANDDIPVFPVPLETIDLVVLEVDLYLRHKPTDRPALYRAAGLPFDETDVRRLKRECVTHMYVPVRQHAAYRRMLFERLNREFADDSVSIEERSGAVRAACAKMIEDVMLSPGDGATIATVEDISKSCAHWAVSKPDEFGYIMDMSGHDFNTVTHMVNVGVGCGLLAKALCGDDEDLVAVMVEAGLLHDVGKRGIPSAILNKEGKLDEQEWELMRSHPQRGYETLLKAPALPAIVLEMARDHHERLDGKGYPAGKRGDQISFAARLCAVVDVYDALVAARPYRGPMSPDDAIRIMREGRGSQFDTEILDAWIDVVRGLTEQDPGRIPTDTCAAENLSLESLIPAPKPMRIAETGAGGALIGSDNRRRYERCPYAAQVRAKFIQQMKQYPVEVGEPFMVTGIDLSRGGTRVIAPFAFSRGDLLELTFAGSRGSEFTRFARVIRVNRGENGSWLMGMGFVSEANAFAA